MSSIEPGGILCVVPHKLVTLAEDALDVYLQRQKSESAIIRSLW